MTENIDFDIPSGSHTNSKDWLPIMIWYHDKGRFSQLRGKNLDMTVLYCFGAFDSIRGTSFYYDDKSPYYGAFYGGYAIKNITNPKEAFGFNEDGSIKQEELESVAKYDQMNLVLPALGCINERVFKTQIISIEDDIDYIDYKDWTRIDTAIYTNGPSHRYSKFNIGYLQYGNPLNPSKSKEDFNPQWFQARMYAKYFKEIGMTICLYVMCKDKNQIEICDENLLRNAKISFEK